MTGEWLDVVHGMVWEPNWRTLAGPIHLVDGSTERDLARLLRELGFELFFIDGERINDRNSLFDELSNAFVFPDYCGKNWDAFNDCFGDFCEQRHGPFAVIWRNSDMTFKRVLKEFLESVAILYESANLLQSVKAKPRPVQMEVFYLGSFDSGYGARPRGLK